MLDLESSTISETPLRLHPSDWVKHKQENEPIKNKRQVGSHRLKDSKLYQNHDFRRNMVKPVEAYLQQREERDTSR